MGVVNKKVNLKIAGLNGNAFVLMGAFQRQAKKEGWTKEEVDSVLTEAKSGNYEHLLETICDHCEDPIGGDDEDDWEDDD